jgi:2-dehydropantoate 2-reductase
VDPGGTIASAIETRRVIGCVVHVATSTPEPGLVRHKMGQGLIIGEARGGRSAEVQAVADLLAQAGFEVTHSADVRHDIWFKLWGNLTMNPVSAITGATLDRLLADPLVKAFCSAAMREAAQVGERIGCAIHQTPDDRHAITTRLGAFKTSMLQDVEAGRPIELDGIVTVVHEMGRRVGIATPNVDALLGLARLFGRVQGLYPAA